MKTFFPSAWECPGINLEENKTIFDGLKRELLEEIGFDIKDREIKIINYYDELKNVLYYIELDFLIEVDRKDFEIRLSLEHDD